MISEINLVILDSEDGLKTETVFSDLFISVSAVRGSLKTWYKTHVPVNFIHIIKDRKKIRE